MSVVKEWKAWSWKIESTFLEKKTGGRSPNNNSPQCHECVVTTHSGQSAVFSPQVIIITVTPSASQLSSEALERSLGVFWRLAMNLQHSPTPLCAGKEQAWGDGCHRAAKCDRCQEVKSLEPLKGFQECQRAPPARSPLNAYFGCLLSTESARQAFTQRKKVFGAHERGKQSLSDVNGEIQEVGNKVAGWGGALRKGRNKRPKRKRWYLSTYAG